MCETITRCLELACERDVDRQRETVALWLELSDGSRQRWVLADSPPRIEEDDCNSVVAHVSCKLATFFLIAKKELTLTKAVLKGKLTIKGKQNAVKAWKPVLASAMATLRASPQQEDIVPKLKPFRIEARFKKGKWRLRLKNDSKRTSINDLLGDDHDDSIGKLDALRSQLSLEMGLDDFDEHGFMDRPTCDFSITIELTKEFTFKFKATSKDRGQKKTRGYLLNTCTTFHLRPDSTYTERRDATDLVFSVIACLATPYVAGGSSRIPNYFSQ